MKLIIPSNLYHSISINMPLATNGRPRFLRILYLNIIMDSCFPKTLIKISHTLGTAPHDLSLHNISLLFSSTPFITLLPNAKYTEKLYILISYSYTINYYSVLISSISIPYKWVYTHLQLNIFFVFLAVSRWLTL